MTARSSGRAASACAQLGSARAGRRAHQVHDRVQHQGHGDPAALDAGRRGQAALGRAGHRSLSRVPARRRGDHQSVQVGIWSAPAPACRARISASSSPTARRAGVRNLPPAGRDPADQPVRRPVPVQQSDGVRRGLSRRRTSLYPEMELGAAFDRAMDERIFEPLGMRDTTFDYAEGDERQLGAAARPGHRRPRPSRWRTTSTRRSIRTARPAAPGPPPPTWPATSSWSSPRADPEGKRLVSRDQSARAAQARRAGRRGQLVRHGPVRAGRPGRAGRHPWRHAARLSQQLLCAARSRASAL